MKRSEINGLIRDAEAFFAAHRFHLPRWAAWEPEQWRERGRECREVVENMLGWDLTDFGQGRYAERGLLLFTVRNGNPARDRKPYAEKIMIVGEGQETPLHFHWQKMEDIINRGGGNLVLELYASDAEGGLSADEFEASVDGCVRRLGPGGRVVLTPGESICLEQGIYHRFFGEAGGGRVLVGEVSQVNDDNSDNRFYEKLGRFPEIEEDEAPYRLLVTDYPRFIGGEA